MRMQKKNDLVINIFCFFIDCKITAYKKRIMKNAAPSAPTPETAKAEKTYHKEFTALF